MFPLSHIWYGILRVLLMGLLDLSFIHHHQVSRSNLGSRTSTPTLFSYPCLIINQTLGYLQDTACLLWQTGPCQTTCNLFTHLQLVSVCLRYSLVSLLNVSDAHIPHTKRSSLQDCLEHPCVHPCVQSSCLLQWSTICTFLIYRTL